MRFTPEKIFHLGIAPSSNGFDVQVSEYSLALNPYITILTRKSYVPWYGPYDMEVKE